MDEMQVLGLIAALAFLPPLLFALWVRAHEKRRREPLRSVLALFLFGGTSGVALALFFGLLFDVGVVRPTGAFGLDRTFFAVVVAAPFLEELAKGLGLGFVRHRLDELEDGLVYGAAVGLGFAATENFVYGLEALSGGTQAAVTTVLLRIASSMLLHTGASALLGFGYGLAVRRGGVAIEALPYYLVAVLLHSSYNFLVFWQTGVGFLLALLLVFFVVGVVRRRIRALDSLPHAR